MWVKDWLIAIVFATGMAVIVVTCLHHGVSKDSLIKERLQSCNQVVLEIGMVMGGSLSSCRRRRKEYSSLLGMVATMILLKSTFSSFWGNFYLTNCPYALNYLVCTATLTQCS